MSRPASGSLLSFSHDRGKWPPVSSAANGTSPQPNALVNELFVRWLGSPPFTFADRVHFFAVAATTMPRSSLTTRAPAAPTSVVGTGTV